MNATRPDDILFGQRQHQPNGRQIHDAYLFEVKNPASQGTVGLQQDVATIPANQAFNAAGQESLPLLKKSCEMTRRRATSRRVRLEHDLRKANRFSDRQSEAMPLFERLCPQCRFQKHESLSQPATFNEERDCRVGMKPGIVRLKWSVNTIEPA